MTTAVYLTGEDLAGLVTTTSVSQFIDAVRDGYRDRGNGAPAQPRTKLHDPNESGGMLTSYMAMLPEIGAMGGYMYTGGFGATDNRHVTAIWEYGSGEFLAQIDGKRWNPMKTGAAGAVGVDSLARKDASTIGVIGSGKQARGQLVATAEVRPPDRVTVFSPTKQNRNEFAAAMDEALDADVTAVNTPADGVSESDIVITATRATEPVFQSDDLTPGTHITAMGQYDPAARELDAETIARAKYVPDLRERAFQDAGSFLHALNHDVVSRDHVYAELGDVVVGSTPGRTSNDEITIFDSGGTAIETVAAAHMLYERATDEDLGIPIPMA